MRKRDRNNMMRFIPVFLLWASAAFAAAPPGHNAPGAGNNTQGSNGTSGGGSTSGIAVDATCNVGLSRADLDINNVRARYMNQGDMFWDPGLSLPRYEVPKRTDNATTSKHSMFAAAIWLGGLERGTGNLVVMVQTYRGAFRNYWPGPINNSSSPGFESYTTNRICSAWDQIFKCNRQTVRNFFDDYQAGLITKPEDIPEEVRLWPGRGNPYLKARSEFAVDPAAVASVDNNLANFFDRDSNGVYNPLNGDYPLWAGTEKDVECEGTEVNINSGADQVLWWVSNDVGNKKNFQENTNLIPGLGMEIHYEAFAYASTDATNDMTFLRQKLYNKGNFILDETYLAQWADPDLGNASDDYVGCDVMRGLGICYNGDDNDEGQNGYGVNPPAIGVDFFRGPFPDDKFDQVDWDLDCNGPNSLFPDTNERIVMSGFVYYNIGGNPRNGDPTKAADFYNYLRNKWKDGSDISFGGAGLDVVSPARPKARYMFPNVTEASDPYGFACGNVGCNETRSCGAAWNEKTAGNPPGDRRFLANNGPFTLKPGSVNECTIGIVWARADAGGATGSFGKLLAADDLAQDRFNTCFKRNIGPNNPNLEFSEMDRKLILTIIPDTIVKSPLQTTETYFELNRSVTAGTPSDPQDIYYRFQGYKIYQLVNDRVSVQDLDNPDKARLLDGDVNGDGVTDFNGIMDVQDGVTSISNIEFNADLDMEVKTPKVKNTPDKGIFRSFQVERDMFSSISGGRLSNFKKYYYAVVAYGYNRNKEAKRPYIQGVLNYKIYTAIPHKFDPESFGTSVSAGFGSGFKITRVTGVGNSGNVLELDNGMEDQILANGRLDRITYQAGQGPIDIKIYNPKGLANGRFQVKLSSRIRYDIRAGYQFQVGDQIVGDADFPVESGFRLYRRIAYTQGRATIRRIVPVVGFSNLVDLDIDFDPCCPPGHFSYQEDKYEVDSRTNDTTLVEAKQLGVVFRLANNSGASNKVVEFAAYDFWRLIDLSSGEVTFGSNPISALSEELIPRYGISLRPKKGINPGTDPFNSLANNGALTSKVEYGNPLRPWVYPVSSSFFPHIRSDRFAFGITYQSLDPFRNFQNFGEGAWAPYSLGARMISTAFSPTNQNPGGPQYPNRDGTDERSAYDFSNPNIMQAITRTGNVDIVFTHDRSKWTRCAVLQYDTISTSQVTRVRFGLAKSNLPSVDRNFNPDGTLSGFNNQPSRGMSWFPGYAIDLDRGVRLNMMFSESRLYDPSPNGNDLRYEPRASLGGDQGTKNFVFVMNTPYDEGRRIEAQLDSIYTNFATQPLPSFMPRVRSWHLANIMYYGLMGRGIDFAAASELPIYNNVTEFDKPVRVKLRVSRAFNAYSHPSNPEIGDKNPVYEFQITEGSSRNVASVGKSVLDQIRIVPNPYLSVSGYENSQIDNRVKIVNLPTQCVVSIFNLSGTLIRQFNFDQSSTRPYAYIGNGEVVSNARGTNFQTFLEWDLKNQNGLPIASGVYIIHVKSEKYGEKVIKWFGVLRPIDLDTFN